LHSLFASVLQSVNRFRDCVDVCGAVNLAVILANEIRDNAARETARHSV